MRPFQIFCGALLLAHCGPVAMPKAHTQTVTSQSPPATAEPQTQTVASQSPPEAKPQTQTVTIQSADRCTSAEALFETIPRVPASSAPTQLTLTLTRYNATDYEPSVVMIQGNAITVRQRLNVNSIAVSEVGRLVCTTRSVDLGRLAAGTYSLTWVDDIHDYQTFTNTYEYSFAVE